MNNLTIGLLGALLATNQPQAVSNLVQQQTGVSIAMASTNDPASEELRKIMEADDAALDEVNKWISDNDAFAKQGAGESNDALNKRIHTRLDEVRKSYSDYLKRYPKSAKGYLAYGTFLNDIGEEYEASLQYEKSREFDPSNPAVWNNLANYYGEFSPVTNAFAYYAKAIELDPTEPVYYENFATTVYLFRKDAREYYGINEQQVFDKALDLYRKAMKLVPDNFPLATDYAQSYYGIKPLRTNDALIAWTNALHVAHNDIEREGVLTHLARVKIAAGRFDEARDHLNAVTNALYGDLKRRLERNLLEKEHPGAVAAVAENTSNSPPATITVTNDSPKPAGPRP